MSRVIKISRWVVTVLLSLIFLMAGVNKVFQNPSTVEQFVGWGYPSWFMTGIGVAEILGAIGLYIPQLARWAAIGLVLIMFGAAFTHIRAGEWPNPIFNLIFAAGLLWMAKWRASK